jgi:XTP/dITP diphosphohydrolase
LRQDGVRLVLATRNEHKLRELSALMRPHELEPLPDEVGLPPETGTTFEANALIKGRAAAAALEVPVIADDSGIAAAALGGAPGVFSARFAGEGATDEENLDKLLRDVPPDGEPGLTYVCVLVYVEPGGREIVVEGRCEGRITHEPRGDGGFGYDPAFVPADYDDGRTMAELSQEEKDAISHRGRAARDLAKRLNHLEPALPRLRNPFELGERKRRRPRA